MESLKLQRSDIIEELKKYLETDTLIYWESEGSDLRMKQEKIWGEALDIFSKSLNLPKIRFTDGLFEVQQDYALSLNFTRFLISLNNFQLAGKFFK